MYSYSEIIKYYKVKNKEYADKYQAACKFIADFTTNILNSMYGGKSNSEDAVGTDDGSGIDDMTDEQIMSWHDILSQEEFDEMFKDYDLADLFPPVDNVEAD